MFCSIKLARELGGEVEGGRKGGMYNVSGISGVTVAVCHNSAIHA